MNETGKYLTDLLMHDPDRLLEMEENHQLEEIFPELHRAFQFPQNNKYHFTDVGRHSLIVVKNVDEDPVLRWAAILHDLGKPDTCTTDEEGYDHYYGHPQVSAEMCPKILERYGFDQDFIEEVKTIVLTHDHDLPTKKSIRKFLTKYGKRALIQHYKISLADMIAHEQSRVPELLQILETSLDAAKEVITEDYNK